MLVPSPQIMQIGRLEQHGKLWRVVWRNSGQRLRRSFGTRSEAEAFLEELRRVKGEEQEANRRRSAPLTVADVVDAYYERRKRRLQLSTQNHYEYLIRKHIVPKIGSFNARELAGDPGPLHDFYDSLPPTTALHVHQILRPAFQYAVDHRRLDRNPCSVARPPRARRKRKLIPTPEEVQKIVLAAQEQDERFGLYVWIVARLGLRRGEACALRWEDLDADRGLVHIRRTVARRKGGTFLKFPKSGEERSLRVGRSFFDHLEPFRRSSVWLFPRSYNAPYRTATGMAPHSTAGRLLLWLADRGGSIECRDGRAGIAASQAVGLGTYSAAPMLRWLDAEGYITRQNNASRIFALSLTALGSQTIDSWREAPIDGLPWFPNTPDQRFTELMRRLDMPYTLHSLRHFVATHLYNRMRDWVQLAKFLGHTNPSITMGLYANHVIETSQIAMGEATMDLFDDAGL